MPTSRRRVRSYLAVLVLSTTGLLGSVPQARAQNDIWLAGATTWGDNASWSLGSPPGPTAIAQFQHFPPPGGNTFPFIESNRLVGQIFFTSDADPYTFITQQPTTSLTINNSIGILNQSQFNQIFATGQYVIGAAIQTWTVQNANGGLEFDSPVQGSGGAALTKNGLGDLVFKDTLTIGNFSVQQGRAVFDNKAGAFTMSSGTINIGTQGTGTLQLGGDAAQSPQNAIDPTAVTIAVGPTGTLDSGPSTTHQLGNITLQGGGRIAGNGTGTGVNFTFISNAVVTVPTGGTQTAVIDAPRGIQLTPGGGSVGFVVNNTFSSANPGTADLTINAPISGLGSLDKSGPGILRLTSASNTYSGGTNINTGVLQLTSTGSTGTGAVAVAGGASLVGIGTVGGPLNVQIGGTVNVQNPVTQAPGRLTQVNGNTDFASSSTYGVRIGGDTNTDADRSQVNTTGSLTFPNSGSGTWTVDVSKVSSYNPTGTTTRTYTIAQAASIPSTGLDTPVTLQATGAAGQTATNGTTTLRVSGFAAGSTFTLQRQNNSIVLTFNPVPEPVGVLAVFGAGLGLAAWRRRARQLKSSIA